MYPLFSLSRDLLVAAMRKACSGHGTGDSAIGEGRGGFSKTQRVELAMDLVSVVFGNGEVSGDLKVFPSLTHARVCALYLSVYIFVYICMYVYEYVYTNICKHT